MGRRAAFPTMVVVVATLAVLLSAYAHTPNRPLSAEETAVVRAALAARESIRGLVDTRDVKALREVYTDDFTHTHGSGKVDGRDTRIVTLLAGDPVVELAPVDELLVRPHGPATAIISGRSPIKSLADGKTYDFRWVQVFVKQGDAWKMAVSQATRLAPPSN